MFTGAITINMMPKCGAKSSYNRQLVIYSVLLITSTGAAPQRSAETSINMSVNSTVILDPLLKFASNIFTRVRKDKENVLLSPVSIHQALNIVLLGADTGTQTESELLKALGYPKYDNSSAAIKYHASYASIIAVFKEISKAGMGALRAAGAYQAGNSDIMSRSTESPPVLEIWNMLVTKNDAILNPNFSANVKRYYDGSVEHIQDNVPESKANLITRTNKWAKEAGFDNEILNEANLNEVFCAMLLSAIRVQASWFDEFNERENDAVFHNYGLKDHSVNKGKELFGEELNGAFVEFTSQSKAKYKEQHQRVADKHAKSFEQLLGLDFHAVEVPLRDDLKFTIFEPLTNGKGDELGKLVGELLKVDSGEEKSKLAKAFEIIDSADAHTKIGYLSFPAFTFECDIELKQPLTAMGLNMIFDKEFAELSNIAKGKVYVTKVKHQSVIEVNKFGLKAAAVTKVQFAYITSAHRFDMSPIRIEVKNPFMFVVRYEKVPLFIGQLVHL